MGAREAKVENYLKRCIKARGGLCLKWVSPGTVGVPDQLVILPNRVFAAEVKTYDGEMSPAQSAMRTKLHDAGMPVAVVYGRLGVDALMEGLDADPK